MQRILRLSGTAMIAALVSGCGDDAGVGSIAFSTWGEEYIENEIPAATFDDGYRVHFDKFLLIIGDYKIQDEEGNVAAESPQMTLINQVVPGVKELVRFEDIEAKAWPRVSYNIAPSPSGVAVDPSATAEDAAMMSEKGYGQFVAGTIDKGGVSKTFSWGFSIATFYDRCAGSKDGKETEGSIVTNGGVDQIELTIHGDHFFYDNLQAANAAVRAEAIVAADADGDGDVTLAELDQVELLSLPEDQYFTGSAPNVDTLGDFVRDLSRTTGHFRGEGECFAKDPGE